MSLAPGSRLGPYEIISPLGAGEMRELYKASDLGLNRAVAFKGLPESLGQDRDRLMRFQLETRLLSALKHPYLLAIFDVAGENGTSYLVRNFVHATSGNSDLGG
jgi:eukaryotic-like serine/threonine-protein kinase